MFFGVFNFFQKTNKNKSTCSKVEFVGFFLEKSSAWKNHYNFVWPLGAAWKKLSFDLLHNILFVVYINRKFVSNSEHIILGWH